MKKILAIMISVLMLVGLLAGCGDIIPEATSGAGGDQVATPMAAGMLVLNAAGAMNISYDADGLVLNVEGIDEGGANLAAEYTDFLGKTCTEAVCDLIAASVVNGQLNAEENYVLIKVAMGSVMPGATFLEGIQKDAEAAISAAGSTAALVVLTEENLDENGYINLESAKGILLASLALDSFDTIDGTISPIDGLYGFSITAGDLEGDYIVDAVTGLVVEGQLEGHDYSNEDLEDPDMVDPTDETFVEETTAPVVTEPCVDDTTGTEPIIEEEIVES